MPSNSTAQSPLQHRQIQVQGASIHVVEGGAREKPAVLFLHGWPESWARWEQIMIPLSAEAHVVAIDLPGVVPQIHRHRRMTNAPWRATSMV